MGGTTSPRDFQGSSTSELTRLLSFHNPLPIIWRLERSQTPGTKPSNHNLREGQHPKAQNEVSSEKSATTKVDGEFSLAKSRTSNEQSISSRFVEAVAQPSQSSLLIRNRSLLYDQANTKHH